VLSIDKGIKKSDNKKYSSHFFSIFFHDIASKGTPRLSPPRIATHFHGLTDGHKQKKWQGVTLPS
ncbi:MAG: hypothetical protein J6Y15_09775, partial [Bacteroidaceae bacterium]|nr:hypothetical protein [Bacteroidaceae bacterium]